MHAVCSNLDALLFLLVIGYFNSFVGVRLRVSSVCVFKWGEVDMCVRVSVLGYACLW